MEIQKNIVPLEELFASPRIVNEDPVEAYEEAIAKMRGWLSDIYPESKIDRALHVEYVDVDDPFKKLHMRSKIWTANNKYTINTWIHIDHLPGGLSCGAQSRKFRTGETWTRGNDLADGDFSEETWNRILCSIVKYETEEVKSEDWKTRNVV